MNQNINLDPRSNEIDLRILILPVWKSGKRILTIATICGILGGIIGFLTPATYTATTTFLPQTTQSSGVGNSLGGLAALAGINLNTPTGGGDIPPTMYALVLSSEPFQKRLLDATIWVDRDSVSYRDFLLDQPKSVLNLISEYTFGVPEKLFGATSGNELNSAEGGLKALSDQEFKIHSALASKISISNDKKEGVVLISVVEVNPMVAAQVAKITEEILQTWIIEHKIKNAKAQYDFIVKQFEAKQKEFFSIQDQLANYTDRNQNVLSASYLTRLDRLQAEFDLVNTVYAELAKQKEQAAIQLSKDTPTFSILNPVRVPKEKTGPKKSLYILSSFFIGLIGTTVWALGKKPIQEFLIGMKEINKS